VLQKIQTFQTQDIGSSEANYYISRRFKISSDINKVSDTINMDMKMVLSVIDNKNVSY